MQLLVLDPAFKELEDLGDDERANAFDCIVKLPRVLGQPHPHAGIGVRKIHSSGIWEARVNRDLRIIFGIDGKRLAVSRVTNHDGVQRFLKTL